MGFTVSWGSVPVSKEVFQFFRTALFDLLRPAMVAYSVEDRSTPEEILIDHPRCETLAITAAGTGLPNSCKTFRSEFTESVMMACVLMVEYGMAASYSNDDEDEFPWAPVIEMVQSRIPLKTYARQMAFAGRPHALIAENERFRRILRQIKDLDI